MKEEKETEGAIGSSFFFFFSFLAGSGSVQLPYPYVCTYACADIYT